MSDPGYYAALDHEAFVPALVRAEVAKPSGPASNRRWTAVAARTNGAAVEVDGAESPGSSETHGSGSASPAVDGSGTPTGNCPDGRFRVLVRLAQSPHVEIQHLVGGDLLASHLALLRQSFYYY